MAKSTQTRRVTALESFAEDLGKLLGTAQAKAQGWLNQRQAIAKQLTGIRDTATNLLQELTGVRAVKRGRRRRRAATAKSGVSRRPKRTMSAEARKAISVAQKKRWAARKARTKTKT